MPFKKYDTNPLDQEAKNKADQRMGIASDEDSTTAELPTAQMPNAARDAISGQTSDINPSQTIPRPTGAAGIDQPTRTANPMTQADIQAPQTGPAYLPPSAGTIGSPGAYRTPNVANQPNYQSNYPNYPPQSGNYGAGYNPQYPPTYAPMATGYQQTPYRQPYINRGLGLDPNIEGALSYVPYVGWIMGALIMSKEPKTNMFARYHALQSLLMHGGMFLLSIIFAVLIETGSGIGGKWLGLPFIGLYSLIKTFGVIGFIILGIMTFQMKTIKIPYISDFVEKHNNQP